MSNISINYALKISLTHNNQQYELETTVKLLKQIQQQENLRAAATECGYSYRKAWNTLQHMENLFGSALVEKQRGKGTQLTQLGKILLDIADNNKPLFEDALGFAENKANTTLQSFFSASHPLRIIASDSEKLDKLRQPHWHIELHIDGSEQALSAYAEGRCELAGFHIGIGKINQQQLKHYCQYIDPERDQFVLLEQRQQGLISHPEQPIDTLQQCVDQQRVFVNRQQGSGTRLLLDNLLKQQNIHPDCLAGYYHEEHTHLAVASMVMSRQVDAGLGIQSVAYRLKLHFTPINNELYFLIFNSPSSELQQLITELSPENTPGILNYQDFISLLSDNSHAVD